MVPIVARARRVKAGCRMEADTHSPRGLCVLSNQAAASPVMSGRGNTDLFNQVFGSLFLEQLNFIFNALLQKIYLASALERGFLALDCGWSREKTWVRK